MAKEIPYDHVARFDLQGKRGNRVQDVINISVDGAFVAVAIGYSFIPARLPDRSASNLRAQRDQILGQLNNASPVGVLGTVAALFVGPNPAIPTIDRLLALIQPFVDPLMELQCVLVRLCGIDFKYSIIDSGTGRELQNRAIHNVAGLGEPHGNRPFRPLAKPMLFMPRSTIRIEVEEISEGFPYGYDAPTGRVGAELFIVLHGYKILGYGTALP
jgi:hypothetical protein